MDWTQAVDIYCERTAPGFWNEPFNAWSNLAFPLGAAWAAGAARARGITHWAAWTLIALAGLIGVGSFLFHTFANRWSELADTIPIWTFVAGFVLAAMRFMGGMAPARVARVAVVVLAAGIAIAWFAGLEGGGEAPARTGGDPLNGAGQYAPALAALVIFSVVLGVRRHPYRAWAWGATAAFLVALTFRTIDLRLCAAFPIGTHFMWHLMNAAMVTLLLHMLVRVMAGAKPEVPAP